MALFPGNNVVCTLGPRLEGTGTPPVSVALFDYVRGPDRANLYDPRTQMRIATIPAGEANAGRKYLGISGQYVIDGSVPPDMTTAQVNAYRTKAASANTMYGGGVDAANPGFRFFFTALSDGHNLEYTSAWGGRHRLFGGAANTIPAIYVESITAANIQFRPYDREVGTRYPRRTIVEHRFLFVDADGGAYNLPLAASVPADAIVWRTDLTLSDGLTLTDPQLADYDPWMRGVPGADTVELGPGSTITGIHLEVQSVEVLPAQVTLPEGAASRTIRLAQPNVIIDLPAYRQNGQEVVTGRAVLPEGGNTGDLDGAWTVDATPGFRLVSANRVDQVEYNVVLARNHAFIERSQ